MPITEFGSISRPNLNNSPGEMQSLDKQLWRSRISLDEIEAVYLSILSCTVQNVGQSPRRMLSTSGASVCCFGLNGTTLSPMTNYNAEPINLHSLKSSRTAFDLVRAHRQADQSSSSQFNSNLAAREPDSK